MSYPQPTAQPRDNTTLFGVLGIVGAVCCAPLGILFGILSLLEARKRGTSPTLAYIAFGLTAVFIVINLILLASGNNPYRNQW